MQRAWRIGAVLPLGLAGCLFGAASGHIARVEPNTAFVHEAGALYVDTPDGLAMASLDGSQVHALFPRGLSVLDLSDDGKLFVLKDENDRLVLGDDSGHLRAAQLSGPLGDAALSPDGKQIAVVHRGAIAPRTGEAPGGDGVDLVNVETLELTTLAAENPGSVHAVGWAEDGQSLWLQLASRGESVRLPGGERSFEENPLVALRVRPTERLQRSCGGARLATSDEGIDLSGSAAAAGEKRRIVSLEGRRRRHADTVPAFDDAFFTEGCREVAFIFEGAVYLADPATGRVGRLVEGNDAFPAPHPK